jgi:very-short-patch-repair endonuclease
MTEQLPPGCLRLLELQRGVIASWQAEPAALTRARMKNLVRSGRWQQLHVGVYATFTGRPPRDAVMWAAVLRAGPRAILSHETAAELDGLVDKHSKLLHVTIPVSQRLRPIAGFAIHRSSRILEARDPWLLPPRTMIEETVLDLAEKAASFDDVIALLARACQRRLTFPVLIQLRVEMRAKLRWRSEILEALGDVADGVHSPLEHRYRRDVERAHGLPTAKRQAQAVQGGRGIQRDVFYRQYGVVVELDGKASHADRRIEDNRRDNAAAARGLITLRYSWADVTERRCATAFEVGTTLRRRGWPGPIRRCGPACQLPRP